jgi:hypothetical protein
MDIMGPLNRTARGNTVILIVTCAFSRYSEAIPLPDQKSETIARAFVENVICRHGMPRELLTDRGTNFLSTLFQNVCKILRIERKLTSSYHPMANGGAENMVKCVKNLISHYINDHHDNWDEFIPFVLFAHRTAVQASILESPFYLNHFRDPLIPLDLLVNFPTPLHHCEPKDYKSQMILRMQNAFELTRNNILQARNIQKKNYDNNTTETFFKIGDRVFLSTVAIKTGQTKKFTPKWSGPYRILDKISDILYKLDLHDSKAHPYIHKNRLKLCNPLSDVWPTPPKQNNTPPSEKTLPVTTQIGPDPPLSPPNPPTQNTENQNKDNTYNLRDRRTLVPPARFQHGATRSY